MDNTTMFFWIEKNPLTAFFGALLLSGILFFVARLVLERGLVYFAKRTETRYDDIVVEKLHPFRAAWIAPLLFLYLIADFFPLYQAVIEQIMLLLILWVVALTINALLKAVNEIYESGENFSGVAIQGYLDIVKIFILLTAGILSVSIITKESPIVLLTGLGALTAVLLLIFQNTILSFVASIQISSQGLIKEGDWIEVPSYGADGDVVDMTLHQVKIQNFDKTITVIPTYKMLDTAYKNWRGMEESGGRRIKRAVHIDLMSIRFCDREMLAEYRKIDLIREVIDEKISVLNTFFSDQDNEVGNLLDGPQLTNVGVFHAYMEAYLRSYEDIHDDMTFLVRQLAPGSTGLPMEVYVFTKTVVWTEYENIQAEIFDHLLASASYFGLRIFQQPTGADFMSLARI
ncbi:MAG: mechanosensitive ion channel domain-containing protein [Chloroflexota bacterium]